jgi:hypothetical protein
VETGSGEEVDGGGEARMVAEFQRECYHNSTVPVKEYLEVIEKMGDRGRGRENRKVKWKRGGERLRRRLAEKDGLNVRTNPTLNLLDILG